MHSLIHQDLSRELGADRARPAWREARSPRPEPPPGAVRAGLAHLLASTARRVDRESAQRAIA
jgi:hypothetical protein